MAGESNQRVVMTIAGFDPSGGAGIIADVRTFLHFGCQAVAAITSLTFQNSEAVFGAIHETAESLRAQILPVIQENDVAAMKLGMLPTDEIVTEVAGLIREGHLPAPVIDPVLRSSSGYELMEVSAIESLCRDLLPLARLITPNIPEAETLTSVSIEDEQGMRGAAQRLRELGARAVLIKGGHLKEASSKESREAIDLLDDQGQVTVFRDEWINGPPLRGTGCRLSAAIASCLAQRLSLVESVRLAKEYVADAIRFAQEVESGGSRLSHRTALP
ncbi:MAG TPA: bifunctional hydroxymethylpyrimidine kinase/phosphomethylpyrimidine kinase [Pyrinomonadaceae bacterium]|nr:bifunctional hydroxymethylpyrimidine kinase/phosphomethylpyrimidine kinase [Pyrinomonadaceae bacterium]